MGCSSSKVESAEALRVMQRSKELEYRIQRDQLEESKVHKLLLLGAGESGKSTLFKQSILLYTRGIDVSERRQYIQQIHLNIILSMKTLLQESTKYGQIGTMALDSKALIEEISDREPLDYNSGSAILTLWNDDVIQNTFAHRAQFQLIDNVDYFNGRINEIIKPDYLPSTEDIIRCRVRTTGISEREFEIDGTQFRLVDVGGQRNERKKWIHCFEGVTGVLFVAAISEYDQVLFEDNTTNRIEEAAALFEEICGSQYFANSALVLFLNKRDLFAQKIREVPLRSYYPNFKGRTYEDAVVFMRDLFLKRNPNPRRKIFAHITCATDQNNVKVVFSAVKELIVRRSLREAGLS